MKETIKNFNEKKHVNFKSNHKLIFFTFSAFKCETYLTKLYFVSKFMRYGIKYDSHYIYNTSIFINIIPILVYDNFLLYIIIFISLIISFICYQFLSLYTILTICKCTKISTI